MSLTASQKITVSNELKENYAKYDFDEQKVLADLKFTKEQLENTFKVNDLSQPVDVWKLKDYIDEKLEDNGITPIPSSVMKNNIWFPYKKSW